MKFSSFSKPQKIIGVQIWNPENILENQDVVITNGVVESVTESLAAPSGLVLIPSGVDTQVHLRVPGQSEKETAKSGCMAALYGGVGAFLTMP
ncbi:MAG: amidohydrolase family protein, partial [Bdellovibrionales bacterium]|nr:amidohydrolase family protein [Bdellovibrionales bacterium]